METMLPIVQGDDNHLQCSSVTGMNVGILTRDTAHKAKRDAHNREGHNPIDIFGVEDLTAAVLGLIHLADYSPSEVRSHGIVGDGTDEEGDGEQVVEDLFPRSGDKGQAEEDKL